MTNSTFYSFIALIEFTIFVLLINYHLNPQTLIPKCAIATAQSKSLGKGNIIDCVVCHTIEHRDLFQSQINGKIEILIPTTQLKTANINFQDSFDSTKVTVPNPLKDNFMYTSSIFVQNQCFDYQCQDLFKLDDLNMKSKEIKDIISENRIQQDNSFSLKLSNTEISPYYLSNTLQKSKYNQLKSNNIKWNQPVSSFILKLRYNIVQNISPDKEPIFAFHQLSDNIFIRLLLMAPFIIQFLTIYHILTYSMLVKLTLLTAISIGLISQNMLIISSTVSVFLILKTIYGQVALSLFFSISFTTINLLYHSEYISILIYCLGVYAITCYIFHLQSQIKINLHIIILVSVILINIAIGWLYNWSLIVTIAPIHLLAGLSLILQHHPKQTNRHTYTNVGHELQQQKIEIMHQSKQLRK